jgi:hypothetical protein
MPARISDGIRAAVIGSTPCRKGNRSACLRIVFMSTCISTFSLLGAIEKSSISQSLIGFEIGGILVKSYDAREQRQPQKNSARPIE